MLVIDKCLVWNGRCVPKCSMEHVQPHPSGTLRIPPYIRHQLIYYLCAGVFAKISRDSGSLTPIIVHLPAVCSPSPRNAGSETGSAIIPTAAAPDFFSTDRKEAKLGRASETEADQAHTRG